ncbi:hypothetical protein [Streptomyces sp. NPDC048462]|uniref:hypothetical protein n=1 Tax=Streptomyces sp. NPDC048462 TaxID=3365555 RepID=UPI00371F6EAA
MPDGAVRLRPRDLIPDATDEAWAARPEYLDESGSLVASIGGLLVEKGDRALLIDVVFGRVRPRGDTFARHPLGA